jgi:hypothetical protein
LFNAVMAKDLIPEGEATGIRWFLDVVGLLDRIYHILGRRVPEIRLQSKIHRAT